MAIKLITSYKTLIMYAREVDEARKSGDKERLERAIARHEDYRQMCLKADEMYTGLTNRDLSGKYL